ncbi:MAG TPA: helix-turn-helix transcriptional regulator [Phycisphaerae bacterium]|nr:helix-turn-helix transcriptional regulator [Phycisphaerae bacterium]
MDDRITIAGAGSVLRQLRTKAGLSLDDLAGRLDWDKGRLSKYENDQLGLSLDVIEQIAVALDQRAEPVILRLLQHRYPSLASPRSKVGRLLREAVDEMTR